MPNYTFRNKETGEEWTEFFTIAGMEEFLEKNSNIDIVPAAPFIGDPIQQGIRKPDGGWREVLTKIKKSAGKRSTINIR